MKENYLTTLIILYELKLLDICNNYRWQCKVIAYLRKNTKNIPKIAMYLIKLCILIFHIGNIPNFSI